MVRVRVKGGIRAKEGLDIGLELELEFFLTSPHEPGVLLGGPRDCVRVHEPRGEEGDRTGDFDADDGN